MTRPAAAALVALLVVLAGCGSTAAPSTTTRAPTTDATATATPTPTRTTGPDVDLASVPGVSADGVDAKRLTEAHDARLNETSYRLHTTVRRGSTRLSIEVATAAGPVPTYLRSERPNRTREEYFNERYYGRLNASGNVSYTIGRYAGRADFSGASIVREYMALARYEPTGTTTVDGTPAVVLTAGPDDVRDDAFGDVTMTEFGSRVVVDRNGVVRSFRFDATGTTADGRRFVVRVDLQVTRVGETVVRRPDWLDEAREAVRNDTSTATTTAAAVDARPA